VMRPSRAIPLVGEGVARCKDSAGLGKGEGQRPESTTWLQLMSTWRRSMEPDGLFSRKCWKSLFGSGQTRSI
jgi:hypothetical protein